MILLVMSLQRDLEKKINYERKMQMMMENILKEKKKPFFFLSHFMCSPFTSTILKFALRVDVKSEGKTFRHHFRR
jgi:hypothetical protein